MQESINLHIEQLILEGVHERDRARVGESIRQELTRLLSDGGIPAGLLATGGVPSLDGGTYSVPPNAKPESAGASIAQAIYNGM